MDSAVTSRPGFEWNDVAHVAARFGGDFEFIKMLPSERDQNFLRRRQHSAVESVVLKVHNPSDDPAFVELQSLSLERAAAAGARCQRLLRAQTGAGGLGGNDGDGAVSSTTSVELPLKLDPAADGAGAGGGDEGAKCQCRMLSFLPGRMLGDVAPELVASASGAAASDAGEGSAFARLWGEVGRSVGMVTKALQGLDHPTAHREFPWDLAACERVIALRRDCVEETRRPLLDQCVARYKKDVAPLIPKLRRSVVHNDPNDYNLVVLEGGGVGVLDFGDMLYTYTCADAAICMAYLLFHCPPNVGLVDSVVPFVQSLHGECPLEEPEVDALFGLALMRACTSVCMSAYQSSLEPDNEYLLISAKPAWAFLERTSAEGAEAAAPALLRQACGLPPLAASALSA